MNHWHTHIRVELAKLSDAFPGWSFRFESLPRLWVGEAALGGVEADGFVLSGSVALSAHEPATLARLIRAQRMQILVVP
jgi:hypothetical protein